jgi:hypothetical protein
MMVWDDARMNKNEKEMKKSFRDFDLIIISSSPISEMHKIVYQAGKDDPAEGVNIKDDQLIEVVKQNFTAE